MTYQPPAWGVPQPGPVTWSTAPDQVQTVQPAAFLPPPSAGGRLGEFVPGWRGTAHPIQVSATMDVNVKTTELTVFDLDGPSIDMAAIIAGGPKSGLYIGEGQGYLAARTAGVYALTMRVERAAGAHANCLMRLGFGPHRILSNLEIVTAGALSKTYEAVRFNLQPGLYSVAWAFGCWQGTEVIGPGRITLMVGHPGEPNFLPARADDFVR